jgi:hypothetical protein
MSGTPIYCPPSESACFELARRFCEASATAADDSSLASWEMIHGMACFLHAVGALVADNLNRQAQEVDTAA